MRFKITGWKAIMKILLVNRWRHLETVGGAESVFFRWPMNFPKAIV